MIEQITGGVFDFEIYFSKIFEQHGGFDVVIGNPPYVRQELFTAQKPQLKAAFPKVFAGTADLLVYFYAKGIELLRPHGTLALITSNKFMRAGYGEKLRTHLTSATTLHTVIDFGDLPVFDATAYPCIVLVQKQEPAEGQTFQALNVNEMGVLQRLPQEVDKMAWPLSQVLLSNREWSLEDPAALSLLDKLQSVGTCLNEYMKGRFYRGITTGYNEAFVVDQATRNRLVGENPKSAEILKPFLSGKDVKRWQVIDKNLWLIFTRRGIQIDNYPVIKNYLTSFKEQLTPKPKDWPTTKNWGGRKAGPYKWYEIQDSSTYWKEFEQPKILWAKYGISPAFSYDTEQFYSTNTVFIMPTSQKFLVGILNSKVIQWFATHTFNLVRGGYIEWIPENVGKLPIPVTQQTQQILLTKLVDRMLGNVVDDVSATEKEIDSLVYQLYGLTDAEIALVEAQVGR